MCHYMVDYKFIDYIILECRLFKKEINGIEL